MRQRLAQQKRKAADWNHFYDHVIDVSLFRNIENISIVLPVAVGHATVPQAVERGQSWLTLRTINDSDKHGKGNRKQARTVLLC
jgi:hypothetical protein